MPYSLSTTPRARQAQGEKMYAITRTAKAGRIYHDISFKLIPAAHKCGEAFDLHLPAGTPLFRVLCVRDIARKAIESGMITDRAAWNNLVGQLVKAIKALNKSAAVTDTVLG